MQKKIRFFLGSNTRYGFLSYFNDLWNPERGERLYILKGGPGCGKSTLMKKIGQAYEDAGIAVEYIPCASDPDSLDAIRIEEKQFSMMDGTPPHVMEPVYPGAYETLIPMGDCWDESLLHSHLDEIMAISTKIGTYHKCATEHIKAAAAVLDLVQYTAKNYIDTDKADTFIKQISELLGSAPKGKTHKRLLSAVSVGQTVFFSDTLHHLCKKIYVIDDPFCAGAHMVLHRIAQIASSAGISCIICPCAVMGGDVIDHIIFPEIGLGITTDSSFYSIPADETVVYVNNIQTCTPDSKDWDMLTKNISMAKALIASACAEVEKAKRLHDDLEKFYVEAMDFQKVAQLQAQIIRQVEASD